MSNEMSEFYGAAKCIDGSRVSACVSSKNYDSAKASNHFSVRVEGAVGYVEIHAFHARPESHLAPFEVWVGTSHGDSHSESSFSCKPVDSSIQMTTTVSPAGISIVTVQSEPSSSAPLLLHCSKPDGLYGSTSYITVRQRGYARALWMTELVAYSASPQTPTGYEDPSMAVTPHPSYFPMYATNVVSRINERFRKGRPSASLEEAGVLVHMFDMMEDWAGNRPWMTCNTCDEPVDHLSSSIINARKPDVWTAESIAAEGIVLRSDTQFLCAWDHDIGSGNQVNGGCPKLWGSAQLLSMLESGLDQPGWVYNEIIVGQM